MEKSEPSAEWKKVWDKPGTSIILMLLFFLESMNELSTWVSEELHSVSAMNEC